MKGQREVVNGVPVADPTLIQGPLGPETRFELRINGPLDSACLERLKRQLSLTCEAYGLQNGAGK